ncbi:MAG: hypothetical protein EZS28_009631 [Streblomastix strix]|uniref:Uncharacterized protein n=1 Tax=Streblomastix strix TaxID=222440 RepID=A0A5J4WKL3_9EUKA|nr:MAG: hypothetical protein EZS28_009631 [Streblomastix strix]
MNNARDHKCPKGIQLTMDQFEAKVPELSLPNIVTEELLHKFEIFDLITGYVSYMHVCSSHAKRHYTIALIVSSEFPPIPIQLDEDVTTTEQYAKFIAESIILMKRSGITISSITIDCLRSQQKATEFGIDKEHIAYYLSQNNFEELPIRVVCLCHLINLMYVHLIKNK